MNLHDSPGYLISNTGRKLSHLLTRVYQPHGITSEQWSLLHLLCQEVGLTQRELGMKADKDPANTTRILDQLERKGLVERRHNPLDRRSFKLHPTESGRSLNKLLTPVEQEFAASLTEGISEDDLSVFYAVMAAINKNADRHSGT
ncbi:MarR family transcriptional regulator [Paenibacillus sambharensis]|uniref:MarR family transcriptional regulator n=1 Tax=Paenibacillus sambharensis TaxID=1803190 RepID=A0A2W1LSN3_9BACL|nr:MarR family transcriptional regulator [Paenibacillus sambharensis]PZD97775.1 MarR family transcriptional regulator [Paenibacillus sambharensis]